MKNNSQQNDAVISLWYPIIMQWYHIILTNIKHTARMVLKKMMLEWPSQSGICWLHFDYKTENYCSDLQSIQFTWTRIAS